MSEASPRRAHTQKVFTPQDSPMWKALRALVKRDNYKTGSALQENADVLRLFLLTGAREAWPHPPPPPDVESLPPSGDQRAAVRSRVRVQATNLLGAWHRERPDPLPLESPDRPVADEERAEIDAQRHAQWLDAQRAAFGFSVRVGPSTAGPQSGDGVFIEGTAAPGSLVLFYPGVSFEPADMLLLPGGTRAFKGNEYLIARFDRAIVDASRRALEAVPPEALACPLSVAHTVNHPPAGASPNVLPAPVDWDSSLPAELLPLLPNVSYFRSTGAQRLLAAGAEGNKRDGELAAPSGLAGLFRASIAESIRPTGSHEGAVLKGLGFIAARELKDEELFLNYRLNPRNGYPSWYTPVDPEEDQRRWQ